MPKGPGYPVPEEVSIERATRPGRYPFLEVFRGLERSPAFGQYPGGSFSALKVAAETWAHVVDDFGWMYVAPRETPEEVRAAGFEMVTSEEDEIVVSLKHLTRSPEMYVYLDALHEFLHILQRRSGRDLWPGPKVPYVDRSTEREAYAFSVAEARRLGVPDDYLREYVEVEWVSDRDNLRLLRALGLVRPTPQSRAAPARTVPRGR